MSNAITTAVMKGCKLKGERRTLMLCLAFHADDDGRCWPSQKLLAEETNCTDRGIRKMLLALIKEGEIVLVSPGGGRGKVAQYRLVKYTTNPEHIVPPLVVEETRNVATVNPERGDTNPERSNGKAERPQSKTSQNTNRTPKNSNMNSSGVPIPSDLNTSDFIAAWEEFKEHRRQIRKPFKPMAEECQLRNLLEMGHDRAVAALRHSSAQGYQGIFEPKTNGKHPAPHKPIDFTNGF